MKHKLLIIDDDEGIRTQMKWGLAQDYEVLLAEDRVTAIEMFHSARPLVTLLDLGLPPHPNDTREGFATLTALLAEENGAKVIIISGQGEKEKAIEAVGSGAYDFLCKPVDMDELKLVLKRCSYVAELEEEYRKIQRSTLPDSFEGMLGSSATMQQAFETIRKVATTEVPVLILGESGTGKEMVAHGIHNRSLRKDGPFVAINCSAIPETLLESELFGHEKGSFTGAHAQRKGHIESAAGGTLFLDEIGELSAPLQVKLLRFLQEKRLQRVGGRQEIEIDVRVIAATNADLMADIKDGLFREDLFYRLAVVSLKLPPLRERVGDIPLLARAFLQQHAGQASGRELSFSPDAIRAMNRHAWPGNVRELENRVKRAAIMAEGTRITATDLELTNAKLAPGATLKQARENVEREVIQLALERQEGNISRAAADLGVSRPTLYELMGKLGFRKSENENTSR